VVGNPPEAADRLLVAADTEVRPAAEGMALLLLVAAVMEVLRQVVLLPADMARLRVVGTDLLRVDSADLPVTG
jgi:hypothetical protein